MTTADTTTTSPPVRVWLAGATGLVGRALLERLLERPEVAQVTTFVRRPLDRPLSPKVRELVVDFDRLEEALHGQAATHVFCCLGTTIDVAGSQEAFRRVDHDYPLALGRAARSSGAARFLVVTALGADAGSRIFYNRVKGDVEHDLRALGLPELHIFRPSLMLGERAQPRRGERIAAAVARPLGGLLLGPLRKYRPIAGAAVAEAMLRVGLDDPAPARAPIVVVHESDAIASRAAAH
jgi:uncharacterized protein YbjT (DUF2867 family)